MMMLVPDENSGILILANLNVTALPEAIRALYVERILGNEKLATLLTPKAPPVQPGPFVAIFSDAARSLRTDQVHACRAVPRIVSRRFAILTIGGFFVIGPTRPTDSTRSRSQSVPLATPTVSPTRASAALHALKDRIVFALRECLRNYGGHGETPLQARTATLDSTGHRAENCVRQVPRNKLAGEA